MSTDTTPAPIGADAVREALKWAAAALQAIAPDEDTVRDKATGETRSVGQILDAADAALASAAQPAAVPPEGFVVVPVELAKRVQESLGEFLMDHGWSQRDMDTSDEFGAVLLAAAPTAAPPVGSDATMDDAIAAGDGTLHGAIDHWMHRALDAERALLSRGLVLEEAAKACEKREQRSNREDVRATCRLCAKDIRALAVVNPSLTTASTTHLEAPAAHGNALDQASREELSIGRAINRAARDLPEGWEIRIDLERYAGAVFLVDPDGNETMSEGGELFSDQINAAIDAAKELT